MGGQATPPNKPPSLSPAEQHGPGGGTGGGDAGPSPSRALTPRGGPGARQGVCVPERGKGHDPGE